MTRLEDFLKLNKNEINIMRLNKSQLKEIDELGYVILPGCFLNEEVNNHQLPLLFSRAGAPFLLSYPLDL